MRVRDVIKRLEDDGWSVVGQRGSHRQFKHNSKPGLVTLAGKPRDDLAPGTLNSVLKQAGLKPLKYLVVIEKTSTGYSAYSPDLPGCIATADTKDDVQREMQDAVAFHLDGLRQEGMPIPEPHSTSSYVDVPA